MVKLEIWDGYFEDGTLAGVDLVRGEPVPSGLYHLASEVLVRHIDGDYLIMQRDFCKPNYGGYFEATAGGSALKGEDELTCAKRELFEETGIIANSLTKIGKSVSRNTIFSIFLCITDCIKTNIHLQKGETIAYKWVSESEFIAFVNSNEIIPIQKEHYDNYFKLRGYIKEILR